MPNGSDESASVFATEDDYFRSIEAHFAARRGTPFIASAKDWALIKEWKSESIPVSIVIEAIDQCFSKREETGRKRRISSLSYCRHAVKEIWSERRDLTVGATHELPEQNAAEAIERLVQQLAESAAESDQPAVRAALENAVAAVRQLASDKSVPEIEQRLMEIEEQLVEALAAAIPPSERDAITLEIDRKIGAEGKNSEVIARTRAANFKRAVRRRYAVPRLSLFG